MSVKLSQEIDQLLHTCQSIHLATLSREGAPEASYTPFVCIDRVFYIFVSDLSSHTQNLESNKRCSILVIEDEQDSDTIFARLRLQLDCEAKLIPRNEDSWPKIINAMENRLGELVQTLASLSDFKLFALTGLRGSFVRGFGQAFRFENSDWDALEHQRPK